MECNEHRNRFRISIILRQRNFSGVAVRFGSNFGSLSFSICVHFHFRYIFAGLIWLQVENVNNRDFARSKCTCCRTSEITELWTSNLQKMSTQTSNSITFNWLIGVMKITGNLVNHFRSSFSISFDNRIHFISYISGIHGTFLVL